MDLSLWVVVEGRKRLKIISLYLWVRESGMRHLVCQSVSYVKKYVRRSSIPSSRELYGGVRSCKHGRATELTVPLQADKMEYLEKELGWKEEDFDFVLQSLRTVLLKRMPSIPRHLCTKKFAYFSLVRWWFSNIHQSVRTQLTSGTHSFEPWNSFLAQSTSPETQHC